MTWGLLAIGVLVIGNGISDLVGRSWPWGAVQVLTGLLIVAMSIHELRRGRPRGMTAPAGGTGL